MTDTVTPPATPPTEAERQAAAIAVVQKQRDTLAASAAGDTPPTPPAPTVHERPEGVPEKFFNKDTGVVDYKAWSAAHTALETQFHQSKQKPAEKTPEQLAAEAATEAAKTPEQKAAEAAAAAAPKPEVARKAAIEAAQAEFSTSGKLTDATYAALEAQGYDRTMVDGYIEGQTAKVTSIRNAAFEGAGGEKTYGEMLEWAATTLTPAEQEAYDVQVNTGKPEVIKAASAALYARYKQVAPVEGTRVGGTGPAPNTSVFNSKAEMTAAMNAPSPSNPRKTRYETDSAYRAEVAKKISASRAAGIQIFI